MDILEGAIGSDHMHMYLSVLPKYSLSHVMKVLKGKSSEYLRGGFPEPSKKFWGLHIWVRGYFVSTVGIDRDVNRGYMSKSNNEDQIREDQLRRWKDSSE
jgi:putative transposase